MPLRGHINIPGRRRSSAGLICMRSDFLFINQDEDDDRVSRVALNLMYALTLVVMSGMPAPPRPIRETVRRGSRQPLLGPLCGIRPSRKSGYYGCLVVCRAVKTRH
ncbi:unnamed protein product [Lota lota]